MTDDGFEDEEALEEHLEAVKPEPVEQEALDELVEPSGELRTAQGDEQAGVDDGGGGSGEDAGAAGAAGDGVDELVEPVTDFRTVQEREAADEGGGGGDE